MASADIVQTMEFKGWSKAQQVFAVKVVDAMRGMYFSIRDLKTGMESAAMPFEPEEEEKAWKKLKKKYELNDELALGQASPEGDVTVVGKEAGANYDIMVLSEGLTGVLKRVELTKDKSTGKSAKGNLKQVAFADKGKWILFIVNQKLETDLGEDRDYVFAVKYRRWKVEWQ
jgi:hypothetical protein